MKPQWVRSLEISSHCNFTCVYCPNPFGLGYGHGNMKPETFDRVLYWIEKLNPLGRPADEVTWLHGFGEPLLNPHIIDYVRQLSKITRVGFSTNGALLTEDKIEALDEAGIDTIVVSLHDKAIGIAAMKRIEKLTPRFAYGTQGIFNDDHAGQAINDTPNAPQTYFHCTFVEAGAVHILFNGNIVTCCIDAQGYPILGSVFDKEIRNIDIEPIELCKKCRSGVYLIPQRLKMYSPSLSNDERAEMLWADVREKAKARHRVDLEKPDAKPRNMFREKLRMVN